jgi:hypothetical protein
VYDQLSAVSIIGSLGLCVAGLSDYCIWVAGCSGLAFGLSVYSWTSFRGYAYLSRPSFITISYYASVVVFGFATFAGAWTARWAFSCQRFPQV